MLFVNCQYLLKIRVVTPLKCVPKNFTSNSFVKMYIKEWFFKGWLLLLWFKFSSIFYSNWEEQTYMGHKDDQSVW